METNIWLDVLKVVAGILTGGGLWSWITKREDKRKTPYDMFRELLEEQKKFYEERNANYEREKLDSAEKLCHLRYLPTSGEVFLSPLKNKLQNQD